MRTPEAMPRPSRRCTNRGPLSLGAGVATADSQVNFELVPTFGSSSVSARVKTTTNGGKLDIFPVGPDFDPEQGGAFASTTVSPGASDDALVFTAKRGGFAGDALSVTYVDPSANSAALAVSIANGSEIVVSLATDVSGTITSTAALVAAAVAAHAGAGKLVSVANAAGNDGSGVVTAMAQQSLALAYADLLGTIYATGNPSQGTVTAGTEALLTLECLGEAFVLLVFTGTTGAGSIDYCDVCQLPIAGR